MKSEPTVIWGIDPGPYANGWAEIHWYVKERVLVVSNADHVPFSYLIQHQPPHLLVIEKFVVYPRRIRKLAGEPVRTSEMIGKLKYWAEQHSIKVKEYLAGEHKRVSDTYLRSKGLRVGNEHARDALRIALWHIMKNCV